MKSPGGTTISDFPAVMTCRAPLGNSARTPLTVNTNANDKAEIMNGFIGSLLQKNARDHVSDAHFLAGGSGVNKKRSNRAIRVPSSNTARRSARVMRWADSAISALALERFA